MTWQDVTISVAIILFSYALIPQIYNGFKTKKSTITIQTSLITSIALCAIGIVYLTLKLYFSMIMTFLAAMFWFILLVQSIIYKKRIP